MLALGREAKVAYFNRQIRSSRHTVLQYDSSIDDLCVWKWPVYSTSGALVPPSDINDHRLSHNFLGPGCLCPLRDPSQSAFTEAAVFMVLKGRFSGKYVAACAQEKCGYLVIIEDMYGKRGLPAKSYPLRDPGETHPEPIAHKSEEDGAVIPSYPRTRPLKRTYALLDVTEPVVSMPPTNRPFPTTPFDLLMKLDSWYKPGLPTEEFRDLFAKCTCGLVMTRRVFNYHECAGKDENLGGERVVIDLTDLSDE